MTDDKHLQEAITNQIARVEAHLNLFEGVAPNVGDIALLREMVAALRRQGVIASAMTPCILFFEQGIRYHVHSAYEISLSRGWSYLSNLVDTVQHGEVKTTAKKIETLLIEQGASCFMGAAPEYGSDGTVLWVGWSLSGTKPKDLHVQALLRNSFKGIWIKPD